jgi:hypothetical protein
VADVFKGLDLLRQEVPENLVGKLPKVTCFECRKKENRGECKTHRKRKCDECGGWLTPAHMHLDYVGHAETTSKLLEADLGWNWEPLAFGPDGLPAFDPDGGLWIKLTVCGMSRLGYGTADNANGFKSRGDLRKEVIGDALRNAAMRFGWALNLWAKTDIHEHAPQEQASTPEADPWATVPLEQPQVADAVARKAQQEQRMTPAEPLPDKLLASVNIALREHGHTTDEARYAEASRLTGRPIASTKDLSRGEAMHILRTLAAQTAGPPEGWTDEHADQLAADFLAELTSASTDQERVQIAGRIGDAVKAGKITSQDRGTLLAAYDAATPKRGRPKAQQQPEQSWAARGMAAAEAKAGASA